MPFGTCLAPTEPVGETASSNLVTPTIKTDITGSDVCFYVARQDVLQHEEFHEILHIIANFPISLRETGPSL